MCLDMLCAECLCSPQRSQKYFTLLHGSLLSFRQILQIRGEKWPAECRRDWIGLEGWWIKVVWLICWDINNESPACQVIINPFCYFPANYCYSGYYWIYIWFKMNVYCESDLKIRYLCYINIDWWADPVIACDWVTLNHNPVNQEMLGQGQAHKLCQTHE